MGFLSTRSGQFTYFALQLGETNWHGKNVLDFGGNIGNMLRDPNSTIDLERYWCIDVVKESVDKGKTIFPEAHWLFYDRYCFFFNPAGIPRLPLPALRQTFDYVVAYSVFTNTDQTDMLELVDQLTRMLTKDGVLAFTFIDPHYFSWPGRYHGDNFEWRLDREIFLAQERGEPIELDTKGLMEKARDARWCVLINANDLYLDTEDTRPYAPSRQQTYHVFYTEEYMKTRFPEATILPPVNNEMQHCCVIKKPEARTQPVG